MKINLRVVILVTFAISVATATAEKQKVRDALSIKSGQPPGRWMTMQSKQADGTTIYGFIVRGSAGVGARWANMILANRAGEWSSAMVGTDREVGAKNASIKVLLVVDGVTRAEECTTGDGHTLNFKDPAKLARLLMRSANVEVGFLPPGAANAVGLNFDVQGFRNAVASSPPTVRKSVDEAQSAIQSAIEQSLGKSNRNRKKLADVQLTGQTISVRFSVDDNLTGGLIKRSAMTDIEHILKAVQSTAHPYAEISMVGTFHLKDAFGNSSEEEVVRAMFKRSTVDKINWDGFETENIYKIADSVWLAPAFQ